MNNVNPAHRKPSTRSSRNANLTETDRLILRNLQGERIAARINYERVVNRYQVLTGARRP